MMTTLMDNTTNLSSRERVQRLYNKNIELENRRRKAAQSKSPSDPNAWHQMRENYEAILLEDLAFTEQHDIEFLLWQLHHRRIEDLRAHLSAALSAAGSTNLQNGKGSTRAGSDLTSKIRSQFKTFLSEATGFYHDLIVKIRAKHGLPLDFFASDHANQILSRDGNISADVKKSLISCHRCLIYLGDLARYKGLYGEPESKAREFAAASSYYSQASSLWPSSGNPHHQLAILALYSGDDLVAIYRYFRSLSAEYPFATARDNLTIAFEKNRQSFLQLLGDAKASTKMASVKMTGKGRGRAETRAQKDKTAEATLVKEKESSVSEILKSFKIRFIRLNGILFTRTSLETFEEVFAATRKDMLQLLASGQDEDYNFGSDAADCRLLIIRVIAVLIFTVHNVNRESESQSYAEILQRSLLLQNAFSAIFEFMGNILERCVQLNDPSSSYTLPGILVFVEWLACQQDISVGSEAEERQNHARSFFWNIFISFLNKLLSSSGFSISEHEDETCFFNMSRYDEGETTNRLALYEDIELRGFVPLLPAQQVLDFSRKHSFGSDGIKEKQARVHRIIAAGKALANMVQVGQHKIYFNSKAKRFIIGAESQIANDELSSSSLEMPGFTGAGEESPQVSLTSLNLLEPKPQLSMEGEDEDEDEVIVFKPIVAEKHANGFDSKPTAAEVLDNGANVNDIGMVNNLGPVSASHDSLLLQDGFNISSRPPSSLANITSQYLPSVQQTTLVQPTTSNWLVEKEIPLVKQFTNLALLENGFPLTHQVQDRIGAVQPTDLSAPFSYQSVNVTAGNKYPVQFPETSVPSKFDAIMSLGVGMDNLSTKASIHPPAGLKKNPVSRPVRHSGPPPGFSSIPQKQVDVSLSDLTLKNHHSMVDDYSWLDGYKVPSSTHGIGFSSSINQPSQLYHPLNKSSSSTELVNFPFPGKQVQPLHVQGDKQNGWPDSHFSEQMKLYQEQQQQLGNGIQQSIGPPEQYHGQSLWEGRFFV